MSAFDPLLLRQTAETQARSDHRLAGLNSEDAMHELLVHQCEIELQNDELRRSQLEIEALRARYYDLYDQAPVGYCTLDDQGQILEANLTAADMLGRSREELSRCLFSDFIAAADQDVYYFHCRLPVSASSQNCELRLKGRGQTERWTHLSTSQGRLPDGTPVTVSS
jgi:PAS domain S-box-containing protein